MTGLQQRALSALECSTSGRALTLACPALKPKSRYAGPRLSVHAPLLVQCLRGPTNSADGPNKWRQAPSDFSSPQFAFEQSPSAFTSALPRLRPTQQPGSSGGTSNSGSSSIHGLSTPLPGHSQVLRDQRPQSPGTGNGQGGNGSHQPRNTDQGSSVTQRGAADASTQTAAVVAGVEAQSGPSAEDSVAEALARAQDAISRAESSLESIEDLPSARPPSKWAAVFRLVRTAIILGSLSVALIMSHACGLVVQWVSAVSAAMGIAWWGYTRSALNMSGAAAALMVGASTIGCSLRFGATLLAFFFSSSKLTSFKEEMKDGLDDQAKAGGQRDWMQVFCNGAVPMAIAVAYGILNGCVDVPMGPSPHMEAWRSKLATLLGGAFLGYYSACCGDTWASELGPLSSDTPRLITTMRPVRRGTNGGVTLLGLSASILGGMFVGAVFYLTAIVSPTLWVLEGLQNTAVGQWRLIPLGLMAGLTGSVLDSLLGATVQYTGYNRATGRVTSKPGPEVTHISGIPILDNNMVNVLSATITSGLTALAAVAMFGC